MADKRRSAREGEGEGEVRETNTYAIRATLLGNVTRAAQERDESRQPVDPFESAYTDGDVIRPPYDPLEFVTLPEKSDILRPIVDALAVNIEGQGSRLVPWDGVDEKAAGVEEEHTRASEWIDSCAESLPDVRKRVREDLELTGIGHVEILRETATGARARRRALGRDVGGDARHPWRLLHAPSYLTRICRGTDAERAPVEATEYRRIGGQWAPEKVRTTFRKYVMIPDGYTGAGLDAGKRVYFKEAGDPRGLDCETGRYVDGGDLALQANRRATELYSFRYRSDRTPYGVTPFAGVSLNVAGTRKAQEINFLRLNNNMIPPLVVLVSGGGLTKGSLKRIEEKFQEVKGPERFSSVLLLEATGATAKASDTPFATPGAPAKVAVEVKPLTEAIPDDALFVKYTAENHKVIRAVRRVPPILIGLAEDYSYATAFVSLRMFEDQVCKPERDRWDSFLSRWIFPRLGVHSWRFASNGIKLGNLAEVAQLVEAAASVGVGDPNVFGDVIGDLLGVKFEKREEWAGKPWQLVFAEETGQAAPLASGSVRTKGVRASEFADTVAATVLRSIEDAGRKAIEWRNANAGRLAGA